MKLAGVWLVFLLVVLGPSDSPAQAPVLSTNSGFLSAGSGSVGSEAPISQNDVGTNLSGVAYFSPELPFLNIVKSCGGNGVVPQLAWYTATSPGTTNSTHEEGYLALDNNLYVTSLSAVGAGHQSFTSVNCLLNYGIPLAPGASIPYGSSSSTSYRLKYTTTAGMGSSTIQIGGDGSIILTCSPNSTCSRTFKVRPNNGMIMSIIAIGASSYPTDISVVETANTAAYDGGAIFNPQFLAALANYRRLRFMDWNQTNYQVNTIHFSTALTSGQTSAALATAWLGRTGTYQLVIGNFSHNNYAETISATLTFNSKTVTFAGRGLVHPYALDAYAYAPLYASWANRPTSSTAFWSSLGVPFEVQFALCTQLSVDCWINIPIWANAFTGQSSYWTSLATLAHANLDTSHKLYIEYSNEIWNGIFPQNGYSGLAGLNQFWAAQGGYYGAQEWMGTQVAQIADQFYSVYGGAAFNAGVDVSMGAWFDEAKNGTADGFIKIAMNTPDWNSAAYTHHIGSWHIAPYFSETDVSNADANAILASPVPLNTFFCLWYTNVCGGTTYTSVPHDGWMPRTAADTVINLRNVRSGQAWASLPVLGYEAGSGILTGGTPANGNKAFQNLLDAAHRDIRMGYLYYDPTHVLSQASGYLPAIYAAGMRSINQFNDVTTPAAFGEFGALESVEQPLAPLASSPSKWQGIQTWLRRRQKP